MSFGWSVGDLIQAISIGIKAVEALNGTRGAPAGYQDISRFFCNVQKTLEPLQNENAAAVYSSNRVEIETLVMAINGPLRAILSQIQNYDAKLGSQVDSKWYKHAPQKLLWEFWGSPKAKASRAIVEGHLQTLMLLLQRLTYEKINTLPTPINTAQIIHDALDLRDKDVFSQRHDEIMGLLKVIQRQQTSFGTAYSTIDPAIEDLNLHGYSIYGVSNSSATSTDLQIYLSKLKGYAQEEILESILQEAEDFCVEDKFAQSIRQWLDDAGSQWLWIQGPSSTDFSTLVCASTLGSAHEAKVATLEYFCQQEVAQSTADMAETELLLRLTYSFIYQLVKFSLTNSSNTMKKMLGGFDRLDGTIGSLREAFIILQELLTTRSEDFLIVIDGVHLLDTLTGKETGNQAYELLDILRQCNRSSVNHLSSTKVLLGTPGQTPLLENSTMFDEQLDAMRSTKGALCLRTMLSIDDFHNPGELGEPRLSRG